MEKVYGNFYVTFAKKDNTNLKLMIKEWANLISCVPCKFMSFQHGNKHDQVIHRESKNLFLQSKKINTYLNLRSYLSINVLNYL